MKLLVIGGNGFIGSRLVRRLKDAGNVVRVADARPPREDFDWHDIDYRVVSLARKSDIVDVLEDVSAVFHCASSTVPSSSNLDPVRDVNENLIGTVNVLEAMRETGVSRIVYLSSGGTVYGHPSVLPVPEDHALDPISSYGVVKVAVEKYLHMYQALYGLQPVILRPSNPYGPGQLPTGLQGLIASFLGNVLRSEPLRVWGDGEVVRDYLYIDDLIDLMQISVARPATGVFNVGSGQGHSVNEIIDAISSTTGRAPVVIRLASRDFDVKRVVLDISLARQTYGWSPNTPLEAGVRRAWEWIGGCHDRHV